eukprot:CAMPEP_0201538298 /NCGR_PEP_ID=MMETSP0161_2-20130828/67211_1 /ASSEMBLY_ACC=CAM_ASM_000251 /TAXON_ID=180227 /ORGANISM="Neoparamoeba aestuarina, Strain SoJaBio B1-5/56/2" /LENGTH=152 /DNA_ID=CAMNT_0047945065 /DNA_START=253 /DNA_END=708 /DNA_ORIENTATION=+
MTQKVKLKGIGDYTVKTTAWNIIRLMHKKIMDEDIDDDRKRQILIFFRKLLKKKTTEIEFAPIDVLYLYALSYMKWIYPEIGSEILPSPVTFRKHRSQIEEVLQRYQQHESFSQQHPHDKETITSFVEYLEVTEKALVEYEAETKEQLNHQE